MIILRVKIDAPKPAEKTAPQMLYPAMIDIRIFPWAG